jgi:hypothetical protein
MPGELPKDHRLLDVIPHPSVVIILGRRGSGKSGLEHRLGELLRFKAPVYTLGIPEDKHNLFPEWVGFLNELGEAPLNSVILVDESYLFYHARDSLTKGSLEMSQILNLSRQRIQTLIFVVPEGRQLDKNVESSANVIIFKEPGLLQIQFERPELREIAKKAKEAFEKIKDDKRKWAFVYSDNGFCGLLENSLPSFWKEEISHIFARGISAPAKKFAKAMTKEEKKKMAEELEAKGYSDREIAKIVGVKSHATIGNWRKERENGQFDKKE